MTEISNGMATGGLGADPEDTCAGPSGATGRDTQGIAMLVSKPGLAHANQGGRPMQTCFVGVPPDLTAERAVYKNRT